MSRAKSMKEMEDAVRWQADQEEAELRHTSAHIRRIINQSAQRLRMAVSTVGDPYFLVNHSGKITPGRAVDPTGSTGFFPWGLIDTSVVEPEILKTYGIDLKIGTSVISLDHVTFAERLNFQGSGAGSDCPIAFFEYNEKAIGLLPVPDTNYDFTLWYLPVMAELTADDDVLICGPAASDEWIVWDCLWKLLARDNYPRLLQVAQATKAELMAEIIRHSAHQTVNASKRIDTRRIRRIKRGYVRKDWVF